MEIIIWIYPRITMALSPVEELSSSEVGRLMEEIERSTAFTFVIGVYS